jgi:hypothetical protein
MPVLYSLEGAELEKNWNRYLYHENFVLLFYGRI